MHDPTPYDSLILEAKRARERAVAPFSNFLVGAALRGENGHIFHGCNIENCTFGLTVCAERVALLSALAAGERQFDTIAVVTDASPPSPPCGPCRQLMWEFCGDILVIMTNLRGERIDMQLSTLFPHPFVLKAKS